MTAETQQTETRTVWSIDTAHSSVEFKTKHMMVTTVKGRFTGVEGKIIGDPEHAELSEVDVTIDAATIDTRNEQRDTHLRSADFLEAETYPAITFRSTSIERTGTDAFAVHGDLTIHGVTRPVTLDTTINGSGTTPFGTEVVGISAETTINRKEFGLNWNVALETGGFLVSDAVKVEIEVEAVKS